MKKIMIMLAVAAIAVASQAAQMKWGSGTLYVPGTEETKLTGTYGGTATFISLTETQYNALTAAIADAELTSANDISKYLYNEYKGATATKTGTFMQGGSTITEVKTYGVGDTAYGVVIYTAYDSKDKVNGAFTGDQYFIANMGTVTFEADSNITLSNMGTKLCGTGDALTWQAVPEPTSGLLMLVGLAGLALRRRRA